MKKILYGVIALIVLVVIAAFVVPGFMDWNSYKPEISERIEALTGRHLAIDGDIEISILPTPKLRITDVRLSNLKGAQAADMARLQALDLKLALGPLLSGDVQVASLKLIDPLIELERLADGRENWLFTPPVAEGDGAAGGAGGGAGEEDATDVSLDSVAIKNGTLVYRDSMTGTVEYIQQLNGTLSAKSLDGPFRAEGSLEVRGIASDFQLASGRKRDDGHMPVSLKAELGDGLAQLGFEGKLSMLESGSEGSGTLRATGADLAAVLRALAMDTPHALATGKFSVKSAMAFTESSLTLDELQIRLDETQATGTVAASFNEFANLDVALTINRFDLDKITANGIAANSSAESSASTAPSTASDAASDPASDSVETAGSAAPESDYMAMLPAGLSASVDLEVQTLRYLGGVVHQARAVLSLDEGVITVQQASALLPGGSNVAVFGQLSPGDSGPRFEGQMEIESDDARAVIAWLDLLDAGAIPTDRLRRFSLTTAISADQSGGELSAMELRLDASRLVGNANFALGARNRINADLHLDQLNADAYLGKNGRPESAITSAADVSSGDAGETSDAAPSDAVNGNILDTLDATLKLTAGRLSYGGAVLSGVTLDGHLKDNLLTLKRLDVADLSGAKLALSGDIRNIASEPDVNLNFDAKAETILGLMRVAGINPSFRADSLGAISLAGTLTGGREAINLNARLETRPATVSLVGSILTPFADAALNMGIEMRAGDTAELLRA
ncbi:MAG: AsmA family protein, partial [Rhodospirillaceae bacterium]|nr:AsmA family protein [Rhodospirillaceae bacterium]